MLLPARAETFRLVEVMDGIWDCASRTGLISGSDTRAGNESGTAEEAGSKDFNRPEILLATCRQLCRSSSRKGMAPWNLFSELDPSGAPSQKIS
jgi:hypothetical protein